MKLFKNKNALTLVELVISVAISSILILIVSFFITISLEEIQTSTIKTESYDVGFSFKDTLNRFIRGGFNDLTLYGGGGDLNNALLLKNDDQTKGILVAVVDNETKKIQKEYIHGDNLMGYRLISGLELTDINTNSGVIYDYTFHNDKIFKGMRIKDFKGELYNGGELLNINMSIINRFDTFGFGKNFDDFFIDEKDILEFYFTF